jgi:signal transduction histidine kinase
VTSAIPSGSKNQEAPLRRGLAGRLFAPRHSLSGKVMGLTLLVVMLTEVFIYVPSIARYRLAWLEERLASAQIAVLALEEAPEGMVSADLTDELLRNASVYSVTLKSATSGDELYLSKDMPPEPVVWEDLSTFSVTGSIYRAFGTLFQGEGRNLGVRGVARFRPDSTVEIVINETPLCAAMIEYSWNILRLSIVIALATGLFVYFALMRLTVRPFERISRSMELFRQYPEDSRFVIEASDRTDEVGRTERQLYEMQCDLQAALQERTRLANLGTAVSKINHDLRNILTSAQLVSDQLARIDDPKVQRLGPKLFAAIDRAVDLCTDTLKYGRAEEAPSHITKVSLHALVDDVQVLLGLEGHQSLHFVNDVAEDARVEADQDQLYRVLMNLVRNAVQVLGAANGKGQTGEIRVALTRVEDEGNVMDAIDVSDNGPGIPDTVKDDLFQPFSGTATQGGTGLGLAIARELTQAQGGVLHLLSTDKDGTCFRICLPTARALHKAHVES